MGMDFGIFYEIELKKPYGPRAEYDVFQQVISQVVEAERVGFTNFWSVEHHFLSEFAYSSAPEVLYGALSQRTSKIRIGHGVRLLPFPYNHPIRVAEMGATLDLLCEGRMEFGTGRSVTRDELEGFGIKPSETRALWDEALDIVVGAWTNEVFSWEGKYFKLPPREIIPKPLQKPHPPLWFGARTEIGLKRAVRHGDGWMGPGSTSTADFAEHVRIVRRQLDETRRDPASFPISKRVYLAVDENCDRAERRLREWFQMRYKNAAMGSQVSIWGGKAECTDKLQELVRAGAQHLLLNPVFDEMEHAELLAREVMPHLQS